MSAYRDNETSNRTGNTHRNQNSKEIQDVTVGDTGDIRHL
jgi:hypothetical protein